MWENYPMFVFDVQESGQTRPIGIAVHAINSAHASEAALEALDSDDVDLTLHLITIYYPND